MQHTPTVRLPEEKHHRDWGIIIAAIAIVVLTVLTVIVLVQPDFLDTESATNYYADNPELSVYHRYRAQLENEQFLIENPEVRLFRQLQED